MNTFFASTTSAPAASRSPVPDGAGTVTGGEPAESVTSMEAVRASQAEPEEPQAEPKTEAGMPAIVEDGATIPEGDGEDTAEAKVEAKRVFSKCPKYKIHKCK